MGYSAAQLVSLRVRPTSITVTLHSFMLCVWRRGFQPRQTRGSMPKGVRAQGGPSLRDGQAIAASLVTVFTLHCSVAERRSPLTHSLPLYTFYIFSTANPSASLRLCVKIPQSPP